MMLTMKLHPEWKVYRVSVFAVLIQVGLRNTGGVSDFLQTCENCKASRSCGIPNDAFSTTEEHCKTSCEQNEACRMAEYDIEYYAMCKIYHNCREVEQDPNIRVFRRSNASSCVTYKIDAWFKQKGQCATISHTGLANLTREYCLSLCLDTDECWGSSYILNNIICDLHICDSMVSTNEERYFTRQICQEWITTPGLSVQTEATSSSSIQSSSLVTESLYASSVTTPSASSSVISVSETDIISVTVLHATATNLASVTSANRTNVMSTTDADATSDTGAAVTSIADTNDSSITSADITSMASADAT